MIALYDASLLGLLALAFALGFGAGWWTAIGTAWLIIKFIMFGMSDRHEIPHHAEGDRDVRNWYDMGNFAPGVLWPSMWRWPVWRKDVRNTGSVRESVDSDKENIQEREV